MTDTALLIVARDLLDGRATLDDLRLVVEGLEGVGRKGQTAYGEPLWLASIRSRFGKVPDLRLAVEAGRSPSVVSQWRKRLGIAPYSRVRPLNTPVWAVSIMSRLGIVSDIDLAREVGVSRERVRQIRVMLGIAAPASPGPRWPPKWLTPEVEAWMGVEPDCEVARRVNRSINTVRIARRRLGVEPAVVKRSKLEPFREMLGKVSDSEVARRAGSSAREG